LLLRKRHSRTYSQKHYEAVIAYVRETPIKKVVAR
jgi:hypothetical protein